MATLQHQQQQHEFELLNSNMDNISQELEDLLLTNEPQSTEGDFLGAAALDCYKNHNISSTQQICWQCVQVQQPQQQQMWRGQQLQQEHVKYQQLEQVQTQDQLLKEKQQLQQFNKLPSYVNTLDFQVSLNVEQCYVGAPSTSAVAPFKEPIPNRYAATAGYAASNNYEFHYLRPQSFNKSMPNPVPLISAATNFGHPNADHHFGDTRRNHGGSGAYRKHNNYKYNNRKNDNVGEEIDYDKVVINMEELGFTGDDMSEKNPVLRLFGKFRLLNYYLHDVFPYGPTIYGLPTQPKPIPYTMNVQYQVKNAVRNCTIFMCSKERILNANKLLDRELYAECEISLNVLRKFHVQLETFKRIELEHRRCQFVTEEAKVQALRLEALLEQLSDQVRECNLLVHVFDWSMEMKHKTQTENLALVNEAISPSQIVAQNNDDNGRDGNNHYSPPEIRHSGKRQPIRYIGLTH